MPMRHHIILGLWFIFFLSPIFWPKVIDSYVAMDLLALTTALAASAFMANNFIDKKNTQITWLFFTLLILPIFLQFMFLDLPNPWKAFQSALYFSSAWLIYRLSGGYAQELLRSHGWNVLLACIGIFYVIFSLMNDFSLHPFGSATFPLWQDQSTRFGGPLIQTNMEGLFLTLICAALWLQILKDDKSSWYWLIASILPCAGILATASRSSFIVLLALLIIILFLSANKKDTIFKIAIVFISAIILAYYWQEEAANLSQANIIQRFESRGIAARLFIWDMSWRLFLENPILGIGAGNLISYGTVAQIPVLNLHPEWYSITNQFTGGHSWAHNIILQFLVEWGFLGGVFILLLIFAILKKVYLILYISKNNIHLGQIQGAVGALLMLMHGMVSIAIMQGFFLALFALYCAAIFLNKKIFCVGNRAILRNNLLLLLPSLILFLNWQTFVSQNITMEKGLGYPAQSQKFLQPILQGINNPWSSRPALERYFANLVFNSAKPAVWIASENLAYRFWLEHQSGLSLRYLILIAHLKDDYYTERRLINLYNQAYPDDSIRAHFKQHIVSGHAKGEAIDIWQ